MYRRNQSRGQSQIKHVNLNGLSPKSAENSHKTWSNPKSSSSSAINIIISDQSLSRPLYINISQTAARSLSARTGQSVYISRVWDFSFSISSRMIFKPSSVPAKFKCFRFFWTFFETPSRARVWGNFELPPLLFLSGS